MIPSSCEGADLRGAAGNARGPSENRLPAFSWHGGPLLAIESDGGSAEDLSGSVGAHHRGAAGADHDGLLAEPAIWRRRDAEARLMWGACLRESKSPAHTTVSFNLGYGRCKTLVWIAGRTKISSAVREGRLLSEDMVSDADRILEMLDRPARAGSRNGLRESGRGGGSSNGETGPGERLGDGRARLRKGLLEGRFRCNPAER